MRKIGGDANADKVGQEVDQRRPICWRQNLGSFGFVVASDVSTKYRRAIASEYEIIISCLQIPATPPRSRI
ncbi:hypothetical protein [Bradyrhizobium sp. USDA 3315]